MTKRHKQSRTTVGPGRVVNSGSSVTPSVEESGRVTVMVKLGTAVVPPLAPSSVALL